MNEERRRIEYDTVSLRYRDVDLGREFTVTARHTRVRREGEPLCKKLLDITDACYPAVTLERARLLAENCLVFDGALGRVYYAFKRDS